jgi:hypothetical protein
MQNKPNSRKAKINATPFLTTGYANMPDFAQTQTNPIKPNSPKNPKINATSFHTKLYDNMPDFASPKTNPIKPNL